MRLALLALSVFFSVACSAPPPMAIYPRGLVLTLVDGSVERCRYAAQWPPGVKGPDVVYSCTRDGATADWPEHKIRAAKIGR